MNAPPPHHVTTAPEPALGGTRAGTRLPRTLLLNRRGAAGNGQAGTSQGLDGYVHLPAPAVVVYRMGTGTHQQTGIVVETSVEDYRNRRIRRHEATDPEHERELDRCTETTGLERMPVVLAHAERARLRSLLVEVTAAGPDVVRGSADGTTHTLWCQHDAELARAVENEIGSIAPLYIADGHHRMAAAEHYSGRRSHLSGDHASAFTLAALFPEDEMRLLGHHRCLPLRTGTSTSDVVARLAEHPMTASIEECDFPDAACPAPGIVAVHLDGRGYRLRLREPRETGHVRTALDVVALDEEFLPRLPDLSGPRESTKPTDSDATASECCCAERNAVRFLPHPPSAEQVMAISDAGLLLPPKSTWFEPKASAELFARELT